jgi:hypothetical protein
MTASQADQDHATVGRPERIAGPGVQGDMRSKPIFVSLALASLFLCSSVFSQGGLPLFRKMQDALGGADRIAAIRDFEQEVRAESWNGNTGQSIGEVRKRTRWIRPTARQLFATGSREHWNPARRLFPPA